jgi:hypothetical protein
VSASTGRPAPSSTRLGLGGAPSGNRYREMSDATAAETFAPAWAAGVVRVIGPAL